jgi:hypothetical protein
MVTLVSVAEEPGQVAPIGATGFFDFPCSWSSESSELHLLTSFVEVLRLRAINPPLCDRFAARFAQDDGFEGAAKNLVRWEKYERIEKVTGSRDDNSVGVLTAIRLATFEAYLCNRIVIPTGAYPDFLPSCTGQIRVCAFLLRKGA